MKQTDIEQLQLTFMGQGCYNLRSVSDPLYPSESDYHAQFICVAHINCQNIGFTGHLVKM